MSDSVNEFEKRLLLSRVALGEIPPDTLITNATLFNSFTGEFLKGQSIWIKGDGIAYVGSSDHFLKSQKTQVIDVDEMVILPGLIEGHTHSVSNRYGIEEFVKHVIPTGVTTVITEIMETGTVAGKDGLEYTVTCFEGQPIRLYYTIPPLCGLTPSEEITAPKNKALIPFLEDPACLGIGEVYWGNIFLEGEQGERVKELVAIALRMGKLIEGHTAGATGKKLQSFTNLGISSCHEPITQEEVLERLRLGYWVMIREGSVRRELSGVKGIFKKKIDFRRLILCTDGVGPEEMLEEGYLDASIRDALRIGIPPEVLYQMVTINVAEHFHLDPLIGSLSPGRKADLVIIPSPGEFSPQMVMCDGRIIFRDGKPQVEPSKVVHPERMFNTVKIEKYTIPPLPAHGKVRTMELVSRLVTQESVIDLDQPEESKDVIMVLALDRLGNGGAFMGFLKGFGLRRGAYGTTTSWDCQDMIVVGCDHPSMETVIGRLQEVGGGGVYAIGDEVVAEFPAPVCGLISLKPMETIRDEIKHLEKCLRENGAKWGKPMLTVETLSTAAIPHLRITHRGYVRLRDRKVLPVEA